MSNRVQMPGAGMIALGVFIAAFVLLMLFGYSFLAALVFAVVVAAAVAIFFLLARDRAETREERSPRSSAAAEPSTAAAPLASSTPPVPEAPGEAAPPPTPQPVPATAAADAPSVVQAEPERLPAPREGGADDLKRIKGIGPKIEDALNASGIYHLDQIASWGPAEIAWMDENLEDFRGRVTRDDWVGQARQLASGGETEFSRRAGEGGIHD